MNKHRQNEVYRKTRFWYKNTRGPQPGYNFPIKINIKSRIYASMKKTKKKLTRYYCKLKNKNIKQYKNFNIKNRQFYQHFLK